MEELYYGYFKNYFKASNFFNKFVRQLRFRKIKKIFKNADFSVFSSNCVGCLMLHDIGMKFNSPFVNLFLNAKDYIKYLQNPEKYNQMEFKEISSTCNHPVGMLGDLTVYFVHYKSFDEAVSAFKRRISRISYDNLFVIFSEKDGCTYEDLLIFDELPYKNKVVFTHKPYPDIKSSFYIEGFENNGELGSIIEFDKKVGRKIYDKFDFVNWFKSNVMN